MARGIIGLITLAGVLVFALPLAAGGVRYVVRGESIGFVMLAIAGLMIGVEEFMSRTGYGTRSIRTLAWDFATSDVGEREAESIASDEGPDDH